MDDRSNWKTEYTDQLFEAILTLKNVDQCERFFRDIMTTQEIETFSARLQTAIMLKQDKSYRQISKETGMSTATITRINQWIENGLDGYNLAIDNLAKKNPSLKKSFTSTSNHHHRTANPAVL
jgi:TrpR-related protein YerC/YecD